MTPAAVPVAAERRPLALVALAAFVPFVMLAAWARLETPGAWEMELLIGVAVGDDPAGHLLRALSTLGNLAVWGSIALVLTVAAVVAGRAWAGLLIALSVLSDGAAWLVKALVERGRPEGAIVEVIFGDESFAFPSGHVVRATALAAVVAWLLVPRPWRLPVAVGAGVVSGAAMGYSRVALAVHWPTDVLGGLLLGVFWFAAMAWLVAVRGPGAEPPTRRAA